jgi:aldose sugar dehydrogenase
VSAARFVPELYWNPEVFHGWLVEAQDSVCQGVAVVRSCLRIRGISIALMLVVTTACGRVEHTVGKLQSRFGSGEAGGADLRLVETDHYKLQIKALTTRLYLPFALEFLPDGTLLVTEKNGSLVRVDPVTGRLTNIDGVPDTRVWGQGGLMDVVPHPDFLANRLIYMSLAAPLPGDKVVTRVVRARLEGDRLIQHHVIFSAEPLLQSGEHFGSALVFDDAGYLFITSGERGEGVAAQDPASHLGKIIRLSDDGEVPRDNPFAGIPGARPEIYSIGHRNPQSILIEPASREVWAIEHGPRGGDEVNRLKPGANYGWPVVGYGREYGEDRLVGEATSREGVEEPVHFYDPSIATAGATFYTGDVFPAWRGNLLIGGLASQSISRLEIVDGRVLSREDIVLGERVRDLEQGPDGQLYMLTDNGRLYSINAINGR